MRLAAIVFQTTSNSNPQTGNQLSPMVKRFLLTLLTACCCGCLLPSSLKAQDPHFTQFYANPLYLNPAFAGAAHCPRMNLSYRNQWPALQGQYITSCFSY